MTDDFILVSHKTPPVFLLVTVKDKRGTEVFGWYTGMDWDFSTKEIVPYAWRKNTNRIMERK